MVKDFIAPQTNGTISFYLKMDNVDEFIDAGISLRIYGENSSEGIDFYMNYGNHYYFNDTNKIYEDMNKEYGANEWNYYEINFECKQNSGYWNISMNGVQINGSLGNTKFEFRGDPAYFSRVQISTTTEGKDYRVYFDDYNYSWEPINLENDIYERILLNDIIKLIYHLKSQGIYYFIMQKQEIYKFQEIIDYFYTTELYEYGYFTIYGIY